MSISYKNMRAFVAAAQAPTFAEAADKLCLSQPALSTAIKNLETQLGGPLFIRSTRRVSLSPEGASFLPIARRLIDDWDNAIKDVGDLFRVQKGRLKVASMPSFAQGPLSNILHAYHQQFPNVMLRVHDVVMEKVIESVIGGRSELGFVFEPESLIGIHFEPLMSDNFCVVMPKEHELAKQDSLSLSELQDYPMVAMNIDSSLRAWIDAAFVHENIKVTIIAEASQLATLGQLVSTGLGLAIVPELCKEQMLGKSLEYVPLNNAMLRKRVGMVVTQYAALSSAAKQLWHTALLNS